MEDRSIESILKELLSILSIIFFLIIAKYAKKFLNEYKETIEGLKKELGFNMESQRVLGDEVQKIVRMASKLHTVVSSRIDFESGSNISLIMGEVEEMFSITR